MLKTYNYLRKHPAIHRILLGVLYFTYAVLYLVLSPNLGRTLFGIGFLLAMTAGLVAGKRGGVVGSLAVLAVNLVLLIWTNGADYALHINEIVYAMAVVVAGFMTGFSSDQKMALDIELRRRWTVENSLRQSEERLRRITEQMSDMVCYSDMNGRPTYLNPAFTAGMGYTLEDMAGHTVLDFVHPDDLDDVLQKYQNILQGDLRDRGVFRYSRKDGSYIWLEVFGSLVRDRDEIAREMIFTCRDVTERVEEAARIQQSAAQNQARADELTRTNALITALSNVAAQIQVAATTDAILAAVGNELRRMDIQCLVMLVNPETGNLHPAYISLDAELVTRMEEALSIRMAEFSLSTALFPIQDTPAGVVTGGILENPRQIITRLLGGVLGSGMDAFCNEVKITPAARVMYLPLLTKGQLIGVLSMWSETLQKEDIPSLALFANQLGAALQNAQLYADLQRLSILDELTGVYNRRGLYELGNREVDHALRYNRPLAVLMLDLDFFKEINDRFMHIVGDRLLRVVAYRMQSCLRDMDIICRYGGDEFVILLVENDLDTAQQVAERLRLVIASTPFEVEGHPLSLSASIGVAALTRQVRTLDALVECADEALYQSKNSGRNRVTLYSMIERPSHSTNPSSNPGGSWE